MIPRTVATESATYAVVDDVRIDFDALVVVRLVDATSGAPIADGRVTTEHPHAGAVLSGSGHLVVLGRADLVLPRLTTSTEVVDVRLERLGRLPERIPLTVPAGSTLPLRLPDLPVEGPPLSIAGTVTAAAHPHAAIADAVVRASMPPSGPAPAPFPLVLRTPLVLDHAAGSTIQSRGLTSAAAATTLAEPATAGDTTLVLGSVAGCAAGVVVALGDPVDVEHVVVDDVDVPATTVVLRAPVVRTRALGTTAAAFTLGAPGVTTALSASAGPGDGVLLTDSSLAMAATVEIEPADPLRAEVRAANARSGADGRFRIQGIRRVGQLGLTPQTPPQPPGATTVVLLDPLNDSVRVDLTL